MSQCVADERDIAKMFQASVYRVPTFPAVSLKSKRKTKKVILFRKRRRPEARTAEDLRKRLDTTIFRLLVTAQSADQFKDLRREVFSDYVEVSEAIATIWRTVNQLPKGDDVASASSAFVVLKSVLTDDTHLLGRHEGAREEALFCLETLYRAHFMALDLLSAIRSGTLPPESVQDFHSAISAEWWSLLHMECILFAICHKIDPTEDVFLSVLEGFRTSVMAYAHARSAMEPKYQVDYNGIDFDSIGKSIEREYAGS
jgi:hypothetical protein